MQAAVGSKSVMCGAALAAPAPRVARGGYQRMEVVMMAKRRNAKKEKRQRNKEAARKYKKASNKGRRNFGGPETENQGAGWVSPFLYTPEELAQSLE
ncbi:unnamed protein product [Pedinophyceae sp. YPF-701]|nr:unnamed protein product [Pedinophyceae sp. YPF-701]